MMYDTEERLHSASPRTASQEREGERHGGGDPYAGKPLHLPGGLAGRIRESFGIDASGIKLRESEEVAGMGARATARGDAIRFAPGEFNPGTREGLAMLGHELHHLREQALGEVPAAGGSVYRDEAHEARSDGAGEAFASGALRSAAPVNVTPAAAAPVQGIFGLGGRFHRWQAKRQEEKRHKKALKAAYKARDERLGIVRGADKKRIFDNGEEPEENRYGNPGEYNQNLFDDIGLGG